MNLTRVGLTTLFVVTALAVVLIWSGSEVANLAWRPLLIAAFLVVCWDAYQAARQDLKADTPASYMLPLGQVTTMEFQLGSDRPRGRRIELRPDLPVGVSTDESIRNLPMPAKDALVLRMRVSANVLGEHEWRQLRTRLAGPLGLVWWRRDVPLTCRLRVVPDAAVKPPQTRTSSSGGLKYQANAGPGQEILQLRRYRPGDSKRMIDWKATARSTQLITREFSMEQHQELVIAIDLGRTSSVEFGPLPRLGHFANLASRLIQICARDDDLVGLIAFAEAPVVVQPPMRAAAVESRLQQTLAGLQARTVESNPVLAMLKLQALVRHRALVVLMTDLDDASLGGQLADAVRLLLPRHQPLLVDLFNEEVEKLADSPAQAWTDPYISAAANAHNRSVHANCGRFARLGAEVLLTRPQLAERALTMRVLDLKARRRL